MTTPETLRGALEGVLANHGIAPETDTLHSWRCENPDRFPGYCHCIPDLLDDLEREALTRGLALTSERLAAALDDLQDLPPDLLMFEAQWDDAKAFARAILAALTPEATDAADRERCEAYGQDHSNGCPASDTYPLDPGKAP